MNKLIVAIFDSFIQKLCPAFHQPSAENFELLVTGLVLCLGRPTVRNLQRAAGNWLGKHETAFYRFFSRAVWSPDGLAELLFKRVLVPWVLGEGTVSAAGDDTTAAKAGRKVAFAGWFRNAVASTPGQSVKHWAHNWVILCLIVPCPGLPRRRLHLPLLARLYRREQACDKAHPFRTRHELVLEMVSLLARWLGERRIELVCDGAYASREVVKGLPPRVVLISRLRRDAALFALPPARTRRRGRPAEKGRRLASLPQLAQRARFQMAQAVMYGEWRRVKLYSFVAVWHRVSKRPVRVVIVRDPVGKQPDDYFFTTDVRMPAVEVAAQYAGRWGVEEAIRELKQSLGMDQVQSWSAPAVARQVPLVVVVHTLVQAAYFRALGDKATAKGELPSFGRMLTRLRLALWSRRISELSLDRQSHKKILDLLESALLTAA